MLRSSIFRSALAFFPPKHPLRRSPLTTVNICTVLRKSPSHSRHITNATKPEHIPSLLSHSSTTRIPAKPGNWHPSLAHSSGEVKFTVITIPPGGEVPMHHHSAVWDYFVHLRGEGAIELQDGKEVKQMGEGSFLAVPPGESHRVRNAREREDFVFLLAQSPRGKYDFVDGTP